MRHDAFGQAELRGDGAALRLTADGAWRSLQGRADGTVRPALDLAVTAQEARSGAEADLRLQAPEGGVPSLDDVRVAGSLSWPRLGGEAYALAAQRLEVRGTLAEVAVGGPLGGTLRLAGGRPSGALTLPARVAGQPHPLGVRIAGTLADPQVALSARGAAGEARLDLNDPDADAWVVLDVQATPAAWPDAAGALDPRGATLRATVDRDGAWAAQASAAVAPAGRILRLSADAQGEGTQGTADWALAADVARDPADGPGTLLRGTASLGDGGLEGRADVGSLDLAGLGAWLGTELSGDASGEVRARLRPGGEGGMEDGRLQVQADARLSGRAVGTPVELDVRTGDGDALIRALAGPAEATLTRSAPGLAWEVRAVGPEIALHGELSADLRRLTLDGTAWGGPATVRTAGGEDGSLVAVAEASDARASLGVRSGAEGIAVDLDAAAPARAGLPVAGTFSAAAQVRGGRATLQRADLAMRSPAALRADLSGEVWPELDLRGAARLGEAPTVAPADGDAAVPADPDAPPPAAPGVVGTQALGVTLRGPPTAATLRASLPGLTLRADLDGVQPVAASLQGNGLQAFGLTLTPGPDGLRWDAGGGYAGTAELGLTPGAAGDATLHAELAAAADGLRARVEASAGAGPAGGDLTLDATLHGPPWAGTWSGGGELQARLHADPDEDPPLHLRAPLELSGDAAAPTLGGPLYLRGSTTAEGTLQVGPGGLTLDLSGDALTLDGRADPGGWNVDARAEGLPLAPWLSGLPGVRLSDATLDAEAQATGAWGDAPEVRVPDWTVRSAAGRATGSAHLLGDLAARADVDADLGVLLDGAAAGRVHGPLHLQRATDASWSATTLSGALSLDGVTVDGTTAEGDLALGGSLVAPDVTANLAFRGEVDGPLRLRLHAASGRIDLDAELTRGDSDLDLRVAGPPGAVRIDATLRAGGRTLRATGDATASLDLMEGGPPDLRAGAELTAEMTPPDGGEPTRRPLRLHLHATGTSVDLGARTPGLALDARLDGARPLSVSLHGDGLRAGGVTLTPGPDGLRWNEMDGWGGRAEVTLAGEAGPAPGAGEPAGAPAGTAPLRADLSGEGPALRVQLLAEAAAGTATPAAAQDAIQDAAQEAAQDGTQNAAPNAALRATGRADLDARLTGPPWAGSWSGGGELQARLHADPDQDAPLRLRAPLALSGDTLAPTLDGPLHLRGTTMADGRLHLDPGGLTLDLSGDALTVDAAADPGGWRADATLEGVPLKPWFDAIGVGQIRDPELAGELHAGGAWGDAPEVRVPAWALRARGAELRGSASTEDGLRLEARLDADLGVLLDGAATGRLHGPLTVDLPRGRPWTAAQLDGSLDAERVRIAGVGVSGAASLSGPAGAPDLAVEARLEGRVQGPLALHLNTDTRRLEVDAELASDAYGLTLTARGGPDALQADGTLRTPRGPLQARAEGASLVFAGQDGLDGVRIALTPFRGDDPAARLHLPLARLHGAAEGTLQLALDARADPWLRGELHGAALAGVHLPPLALRSDGTTLHASGRSEAGAVTARVAVPTGAWDVQLGGLALPGALRLDAEADGSGATGTLAGTLAEAPPTEGDEIGDDGPDEGAGLRLRAARTENATTLAASGRLRGGEVTIELAHDASGWTGPIRIDGLRTPAGTVRAEGRAQGAGAVPGAALEVTLDGPVAVAGQVRAGGPELQAHLDLEARLPGGGALRVTGDAWPALDLRIATEGAAEGAGARLRAEHLLRGAPWRVEGHATVPTAAGEVTLRGRPEDGSPRLEVAPRGVAEGRLQVDLPADAPLPAVQRAWADGLRASGQGALSGRVDWRPPAGVTVRDLTWAGAWGDLSLAGEVRGGRADLSGRVTDEGDGAVPPPLLSLLRAPFGAGALAYHLEGGMDAAELRVHAAEAGHAAAVERGAPLRLTWAGERRALHLQVDGGPVQADLALAPGAGLEGELHFDDVTVALPGLPTGTLDATLAADGATATGQAALRGPGRLSAEGNADLREWLPAPYRPPGEPDPDATSVSVRLTELPLDEVPAVSRILPGLGGGMSAVIELRGRRLLAQITAPELTTGGRAVPLQLEASGRIGAGEEGIDFGGTWAGSPVQGTLTGEALEVLWTLERFPAQAALEARFGALDAVAEVTGVARVRLPYDAPGRPDVRLATEHVRLERAGVVTTGRFSAALQDGGVEVDAAFEGQGQWSAVGTLRPEALDFTLRAEDADAGPLLGLVPVLSRLGADARGDLTVRAQGSLASPRLDIETDGLELALAGARYRLETGTATLRDEALSVQTELSGVEPVGGLLTVEGSGQLSLSPWRLRDAAIELDGAVRLPVVGELREVRGALRADAEGRPRLEADARMGAPLQLEGTLWPLDVRLQGEGLALRAPAFMLDESTSDVDLRLRYTEAFVISGGVTVRGGRFALGIRPPPAEPEAQRTPNPALQRIRLDDIALVGRRLSFSESFGTAEFEADLVLGGTAAEPRLAGEAEAQRGTFRFSGREFDLERGVAAFERSRGVYPTLEVVATAVFDKRTVLQSMPRGATFEAPSGSTFDVRLAFDAEVVPTPRESRPFRLDLDPVLSSDAMVTLPGANGFTPGARSLTEAELVSLVALGRLTPTGDPSAAGLAGGVARSALDSAIDLLILSELQSAVSEALGIDVVEIRTSTLSNVLDGSNDPFGVSLRLGGYLDEGLFASLQIGRLAGGEVSDALTNTLALTYELGPVAFDLSTELAFPDDPSLPPVPALGATLRYDLRPGLSIESGLSFSTPESEARFGVTLRW
ncbi:MAG: translocation/assembly module TamB domain-containing protein [Trueperaceae bacterium]|nr:translocation/assembly module TamB domain-containing protein [Trueperaceae bacterium]